MTKSTGGALRHALLAAVSVAAMGAAAQTGTPLPQGGQNLAPSADAPAITRRPTGIDSSGDYRRELQACRSDQAHQAREACLEEARNAQAARRSGQLELQGENYMANALMRCEPLAGEDKAACEARVLGFGNASGSVAGGGLLRWVETVVLPPSESQVTFAPKTQEPVVVIPITRN